MVCSSSAIHILRPRTHLTMDGRIGIDWGVYGAPETFLIGADRMARSCTNSWVRSTGRFMGASILCPISNRQERYNENLVRAF